MLTGSSGFLGNEIFKFLIKKYQCESIPRDNLRSYKKIEEVILKKFPDVIINAASIVGLNNSNINKTETKINSRLPYNLAKFSKKFNFHLIHISTQVFSMEISKMIFMKTLNQILFHFMVTLNI